MISRVWALAGLACGVLAGLAILVAAIALAPDTRSARPSLPAATAPATGEASLPAATRGEPTASADGGAASSAPASPVAAGSSVMHIGEAAPVLAMPQVGGGFIDLATLHGRPVWVAFVSAGCDACRDQLSLVNGFLARYAATGLVVLAIDVKDNESATAALATKAGVGFPFGLDLDGHAQAAWDAATLPSHFWVDTAGVIRDAARGAIDQATMAHGLAQILPGVTVTP